MLVGPSKVLEPRPPGMRSSKRREVGEALAHGVVGNENTGVTFSVGCQSDQLAMGFGLRRTSLPQPEPCNELGSPRKKHLEMALRPDIDARDRAITASLLDPLNRVLCEPAARSDN